MAMGHVASLKGQATKCMAMGHMALLNLSMKKQTKCSNQEKNLIYYRLNVFLLPSVASFVRCKRLSLLGELVPLIDLVPGIISAISLHASVSTTTRFLSWSAKSLISIIRE